MLRYFLNRVFHLGPVLIGITILAFLIGVISPGDPVYISLTRDGITVPTEEDVMEKRRELGLDLPLPQQYLNWLSKAVRGDLGESIYSGEDVGAELVRRIPVTVKLSVLSFLLTVSIGLALGGLMAWQRNTLVDKVLRSICTFIVSVPGFWMAIILITVFAEILQLLPTSGYEGIKSLIMPSVVLSLGTIGVSARLSRANFISELNKQYVLTANGKGLDELHIGWFHVFKNAIIPSITLFGTYFAGILGGSSVIESIFSLPGLGSYAIEGIFNRDYYVIQAYVLLTGTTYVIVNLVIDLVYFLINPKIRQSEEVA